MFKKLKQEISNLKSMYEDLYNKVSVLDDPSFLEWKTQHNANEETARKEGKWFLNSKADLNLLQQVIQEINKDPDLAAMFRTSDGTTLTLRCYPVNSDIKYKGMKGFEGEEE